MDENTKNITCILEYSPTVILKYFSLVISLFLFFEIHVFFPKISFVIFFPV